MNPYERQQQREAQRQATIQSGVNEAGRITRAGLDTIREQIDQDLKEAGMFVFSSDSGVNRSKPLSPVSHIFIYGEYNISDFETAKTKMAEYGEKLTLEVTGYDQKDNPTLASFSMTIITMQQ